MDQTKSCGVKKADGMLAWWQLSLIGIGCIIGTGYFLGSGVAIKLAGPSVVFSYAFAALATYIVYNKLAKMSAADPQKGSFCTYSKNAFGHWAGFSCGWVYWLSEMLISGSQLTALSIFARFWFPNIPVWIFASIFSILGLSVVLAGAKGFERAENIFAVIKTAAIFMFIVLAVLVLFGWFGGGTLRTELPKTFSSIFPNGMSGWWSSLIYAFYAFGGIEIMGLMAVRLKKKDDVQKAGSMMLITLAIVYITTILLALVLTEWNSFHEKESPFVTALSTFDLAFFPHLFNGALIIAGFSTMTASMFAVTNILITLSESGDAPKLFLKNSGLNRKIPIPALSLTAAGLFFSIVLALFMPGNVYEYITTAAGLMLLLNWCFILMSSRRLLTNNAWDHFSVFLGLFLIGSAFGGTVLNKTSRIGLYFCLCFISAIFLVLMRMQKVWKKKSDSPL